MEDEKIKMIEELTEEILFDEEIDELDSELEPNSEFFMHYSFSKTVSC